MISEAQSRLESLLRRELGAAAVQFVRTADVPEQSPLTLTCSVPSGPTVVATFNEPPPETTLRRMEIIVGSFAELLSEGSSDKPAHSPSPSRTLAGELSALAGRADALSAVVVDAASPVIWGASDVYDAHDHDADEAESARLYWKARLAGLHFCELISEPVLDPDAHGRDEAPVSHEIPETFTAEERAELWRRVLLVRNALAAVRALPHVANLHKGEHLHHSVRAPEMSYVVRSFATIYMLLLVFDRPFDELRAERSIVHSLPTIERLVLALPPREPEPPVAGAGVVRMRRRGRKR